MCGILLSIRSIDKNDIANNSSDDTFDALLSAVKPRGPDSLQIHTTILSLDSSHSLEVKLASSVLGLRGQGITRQPVENDHGVLAWNGQIFQGLTVKKEENDTLKLFERLQAGDSPLDVLAHIEGP